MSDYRDVIKAAIRRGFFLDSCGQEERQYNFGLFNDLCGMSVEDAMSGCGEVTPKKKSNTLTFAMQKSSEEEYELVISAAYAPTDSVTISFTIDDEPQILVMPSGTQTLRTGILKTSKYANIPTSSIALSSSDETYTYKASNEVKTGIFILTINNNGSKTVKSVMYGEKVELPAVVEKEGYDFVWKDSDGKKITESEITMPEKDYTITGTYNVKKYTLSYTVYEEFMEDGTKSTKVYKSGTKTIAFGSKVIEAVKSEVPSRTGYTLGGWYDDAASAVSSATTMPSRNYEIFVDYGLKEYTIKYVSDGVTIYNEKKYYTDTFPRVDDPEKTGYNFAGWDKEIPEKVPAANYTLTAKFTAIKYYIYYLIDGVEKYKEQHIYGDSISIRANESKMGYTFSGWNPSELPTRMPAEDITVSGTFEINVHTLTCAVQGVTVFEKSYEYNATINKSEIETPEIEGYEFMSWDPMIPDTMPDNDVHCEARFNVNTYSITYYVDGEHYFTNVVEFDAPISLIDEPEKEGHKFLGWNIVLPERMPSHDIDVNGYFEKLPYTVTVNLSKNGELFTSYTISTLYHEKVEYPELPEFEGYAFGGFDVFPPEYMPANDIVINGDYVKIPYTITFTIKNGDDSTIYTARTYYFQDAVENEEYEASEGYTFNGWIDLPATMPSHDVEVEGTITVNQYTLTFNVEDEFYSSITQDYGTSIVEPIDPEEKEGYTFHRWENIPKTMPAEDLTFDAYYTINSYTATFKIAGKPDTASTFEYGAEVVYPTVEVEEGFKLKWDHIYETMPAKDVVINGTIEEVTLSNDVYYGAILHDSVEGMTDADVMSLNSYDGLENKDYSVSLVIPKSDEHEKYERLMFEADDSGDEVTDEETGETHDAEGWQEKMIEFENSHRFGLIYIIPETLSLKDIKENSTVSILGESNVVKTIDVDDTSYTVYEYTKNTIAFKQTSSNKSYEYEIIFN